MITDTPASALLAFLGPIGWQELLILAIFGVLIFGRRLPEVGKNIGKGIVEFKKGLSGVEEEIDRAGKEPPQLDHEKDSTMMDMESPESEPAATGDSKAAAGGSA